MILNLLNFNIHLKNTNAAPFERLIFFGFKVRMSGNALFHKDIIRLEDPLGLNLLPPSRFMKDFLENFHSRRTAKSDDKFRRFYLPCSNDI